MSFPRLKNLSAVLTFVFGWVPHVSFLIGVPCDRREPSGWSQRWLRHGKAQTTAARVILSGAAWGPTRWGKRSEGSAFVFRHHRWVPHVSFLTRRIVALSILINPLVLPAQQHFNGAKAYEYARSYAAIGPRWPTGPGHVKAEQFIRNQFKHDQLEEDTFTVNTPIGPVAMHNFIVRFPGKKDGSIVLGTHYETNYPLRNIKFVGANDGAATTGLLMAIADQLRGKKLDGYSVWLVFFDGEEAIEKWSASDSTYGSRHLAAKWGGNGTLGRIKAFMLADMIGDKDLNIQRETRSTGWLVDLVRQAARKSGDQHYFFQTEQAVDDDHLPFVQRSVPSIDVIDLDYGPNNSYHHSAQDTIDKVSAHSLAIDGDVFMEAIHLINQR
jgi:glutaminyl-peptide cyclotransferase